MSDRQEYTVRSDGWVAGKWRAGGSTVVLTIAQAKYENVAIAGADPAPDETGAAAAPARRKSGRGRAGRATKT